MGMLSVTRREGEEVIIHTNPPVRVVINWTQAGRCNIGIDTKREILVLRGELDKEYREPRPNPA